MEKGCVYCTEMHLNRCPDAFTEVSKHCGSYNHEEAINLQEDKDENLHSWSNDRSIQV